MTLIAVGGAAILLTHRPVVGSADRHVVVTSLTPNVAPGRELVLDLALHDQSEPLQWIDVQVPPHPPVRAERRSPGTEKSGPATYRLEVPLPEAPQPTEVFVGVVTGAAVGRHEIAPHPHKTELRVPVRVWTKLELRALEIGLASMHGIWLALGALSTARIVAAHRRGARDDPAMSSAFTRYGLLAGFSLATFFVLGQPLAGIFGHFDGAPALAVSAAAVALVVGVGRLLTGRDRPPAIGGTLAPAAAGVTSYRTRAPRVDARGWGLIQEALAAVPNLRVTHSNESIEISRAGLRRFRPSFVALELLDQGNEPAIGLRFNDSDLLFEVARHTTGELGPVRLDLARDRAVFRYVVDRSTDIQAVVTDFRREQRNHIALQESRAALLDLLAKRAGLDD
ncbi:MAG: hypothetical protein HOV80_19580 [Polyangiaceae bacterium]|nr:hypothetical protein [Polyangiaceae bacterium]